MPPLSFGIGIVNVQTAAFAAAPAAPAAPAALAVPAAPAALAAPAAPAAGSAEAAATGAAAGHKRAASGSDALHHIPNKAQKTDDASEVQPKGKAKAKAKAKAGDKKEVSWLQKAKSTKQAYASAIAQASSIRLQIDSDEKWAWAKHPEIESAFSAARCAVSNAMAVNGNFNDLMCTADLNAAKKAANDEHQFEIEVKEFTETLSQHVTALQHECKSLLEQQQVRIKYAKGPSSNTIDLS